MSQRERTSDDVLGTQSAGSSPVSPMPSSPVDAGVSPSEANERAIPEGDSRKCGACGQFLSAAWAAPICPACVEDARL